MSPTNYQNIFLTVGTTQFDQLIDAFLQPETLLVLKDLGCQTLTIQYGNYKNIDSLNLFRLISTPKVNLFGFDKSIREYIDDADLVIGHAGAGTALEVLRAGKPLLIVVNESLMDNHQQELAIELSENGFARMTTVDKLTATLGSLNQHQLVPFPKHNPSPFVDFINQLL